MNSRRVALPSGLIIVWSPRSEIMYVATECSCIVYYLLLCSG